MRCTLSYAFITANNINIQFNKFDIVTTALFVCLLEIFLTKTLFFFFLQCVVCWDVNIVAWIWQLRLFNTPNPKWDVNLFLFFFPPVTFSEQLLPRDIGLTSVFLTISSIPLVFSKCSPSARVDFSQPNQNWHQHFIRNSWCKTSFLFGSPVEIRTDELGQSFVKGMFAEHHISP